MPTRCHMGGSEMTKNGALKQILLFPFCWPGESCLPQKQQLSWVVWDSGTGTLLRLGAAVWSGGGRRWEGRSEAKVLATVQIGCCSAWYRGRVAAVSGFQAEACYESFSKWDEFLSAAIPERLATCGEVTCATGHWERAHSLEGISGFMSYRKT